MMKGVTHAHLGPISIIQSFQMSPIPQTSFLLGTFFVASYSKTALAMFLWILDFIFNFCFQKEGFERMEDNTTVKKECADILSILSMTMSDKNDCLKYKLLGNR